MKLAELISRLPPQKKIRIGTTRGSKFIYIGPVEDLCMEDIDRTTREKLAAKMNSCLIGMSSKGKSGHWEKLRTQAKKARQEFEKWTPVSERKVTEKIRGIIEPESLVIMIEGAESGDDYSPSLEAMGSCDPDAGRKAVEQLYKNACSDLVRAYKNLKKNGDADEEAKRTAHECEIMIRSDRYGLLDNPEDIIQACRLAADGGRR